VRRPRPDPLHALPPHGRRNHPVRTSSWGTSSSSYSSVLGVPVIAWVIGCHLSER
jgi:hypothetical protein